MLLAKHLIWEQALDFINTGEISGELLHEIINTPENNKLSSHVKRSLLPWLHYESHLL